MVNTDEARLRAMMSAYYGPIVSALRRHGVAALNLDDVAQDVFLVAARRMEDLSARSERSFLMGTAYRLAANWRRARRRSPERGDAELIAAYADDSQNPERLVLFSQAQALLRRILTKMSSHRRIVFALYHFEEMRTEDIAAVLGLTRGATEWRLRCAKAEFQRLSGTLVR